MNERKNERTTKLIPSCRKQHFYFRMMRSRKGQVMLYKRDVARMGRQVKTGQVKVHGDCFHGTKEDDRHPGSGKENRRLAGDVLGLGGL